MTSLDRSERWFEPERFVEADGRPEIDSPTYRSGLGQTILTEVTEGSLSLPFAPIDEDVSQEGDEPEWTWDGFVAPGSITALGGWPKVGKTTLLFALLAAIAEGEPFLQRETCKSGILLLTEERRRTLVPKLRARPMSGVHRLRNDQTAATPWPEVVRQAVAYAHTRHLGVLVVDTFPKWAQIEDENAAGAILAAIAPLDEAAASGLAVVVVLHQRKARGRFGEAVRGSNALTGAVDVVVELERSSAFRDRAVRVLLAVSRFDETPESVVVALTEDGYEVRGDAETAQAAEDRETIAAAIAGAGRLTIAELAEVTGLPSATVARHGKALFENARIGRTGAGKRGDPYVFHADFVSPTLIPFLGESDTAVVEDEA
jgi:predicted ATP-dependent serine protease